MEANHNQQISTETLRNRLEELREFTHNEFAAQRSQFLRNWQLPLESRVADGLCIDGLEFERRTQQGHYRFKYQRNETDFREGDFLRIHKGNPLAPIADCVLISEEPPYITLDIHKQQIPWADLDEIFLDASFFDLEHIVQQGIDELGSTIRGRERILPLLLGNQVTDEVDQEAFDEAWTQSDGNGYNNSQSDAIAAGASSEWCALIQGPPGSGKTQVLANIVAERLKRGERILVTAFTHRAIHQALRTIHRILPHEDRIIKVGNIIPDTELTVQQYEYFSDSPLATEEGGYVVGATVFSTRSARLKGIDFDTLIIDEASQMTLPLAILGMLASDRYIIIGDPKQLPPVIQSCPPSEAYAFSIFNTVQRNNDLTLLDTTYRMNQAITEWASNQFYNGQLVADASVEQRSLNLSSESSQPWLRSTLAPKQPLVWLEHSEVQCRKVCMEEVDLIHQLVVELIKRGLSPEQMAIVTPFRKQARAIRHRLQVASDIPPGIQAAIVVDTVERMQGQERELIIMSLAANAPSFVRSVADFLFLPARLNVSVTRARSKVIIISSDSLLKVDTFDTQTEEALSVWHNLKASCHIVRT